MDGLKILHVDRNDYYGGESASLNLNQLFEKFAPEKASDKSTLTARYGRWQDYNIDLVPKLMMGNGLLVKIRQDGRAQLSTVSSGRRVVRVGEGR